MGPAGAGKSTFIDYAINGDGKGVGHGMPPYTQDFEALESLHPIDGRPVVFVDTPGFDEHVNSATEVLSKLAEWLVKKCGGHVDIAAIIYLHKIDGNRMTGSLVKNLQTIKDFQTAMPHIVIATTMWSEVNEAIGKRREDELKNDFWQDLMRNGCEVARFEETYRSAWDIVGKLAVNAQGPSKRTPSRGKFTERIRSLFARKSQ